MLLAFSIGRNRGQVPTQTVVLTGRCARTKKVRPIRDSCNLQVSSRCTENGCIARSKNRPAIYRQMVQYSENDLLDSPRKDRINHVLGRKVPSQSGVLNTSPNRIRLAACCAKHATRYRERRSHDGPHKMPFSGNLNPISGRHVAPTAKVLSCPGVSNGQGSGLNFAAKINNVSSLVLIGR